MQQTIIQYYGEQNRSRCGYCHNSSTSNSHGMHAYVMTPQDYQDLIDRGWRRSGDYCYKPNNPSTCCPSYTIRCDVHAFKLTKSQKKVLKRMNRFLQNGIKEKDEVGPDDNVQAECSKSRVPQGNGDGADFQGVGREEPDVPKVALVDIDIAGLKKEVVVQRGGTSTEASDALDVEPNVLRNQQSGDKRRDEAKSSDSHETVRPPCKKAKQMRLERRQAKLAAKGIADNIAKPKANTNQEKNLNAYIEEVHENARHKLTVKIVPSNEGVTMRVLDLYRKYQCNVHNDPPQKITQKSYHRFLVRTPLQYIKTPDGPEQGYGSFHQQYWLDDRLIAVGVIDILPSCVSSVYFFYDPDFKFLSLGTYGYLREVYLVNKLSERTPALKYYYMGFYIHTCPKMIYKGKLSASYLLCPEVYTWHLLTDEIREKLNKSKYQRLNPDLDALDLNHFRDEDLGRVLILYNRDSYMVYEDYVQSIWLESVDQVLDMLRRTLNLEATSPDARRSDVIEYGQLVGRQCAHRMLYVLYNL